MAQNKSTPKSEPEQSRGDDGRFEKAEEVKPSKKASGGNAGGGSKEAGGKSASGGSGKAR